MLFFYKNNRFDFFNAENTLRITAVTGKVSIKINLCFTDASHQSASSLMKSGKLLFLRHRRFLLYKIILILSTA
ncbi:MAG: hypothetical protein UHN02_05820 [Acutalibacteraceae bacterium]|nr:hypothetical protein [Acutalibacteraceae bacterium]